MSWQPPPVLLVVAKAPVAGLAKTRLTPPYTPRQAADLAAAALLDTLDAAVEAADALRGGRPVVALTGELAACERVAAVRSSLRRCRVISQRGRGLAERLAAANRDAAGDGGVLQVGMDTPQLDAGMLLRCADLLARAPAVLGAAPDGGWWLLGLRHAGAAEALSGVAMSRPETYVATLAALRSRGLDVAAAPVLRDVDTPDDVDAVATSAPCTQFARAARFAQVARFAPAVAPAAEPIPEPAR